ncbi:MAG: LPXTG cell wall anchor domain-containing protein [Chloroflexota bacterium]|nr:LPXTG cell wall anchor domain-containing protein [Chloroflexota bacterium]
MGDFCGRTQLFSTALQDLVELGPPSQPAQPGLLDLLLDNLLAVVAGLFALIIAIILYLIRRKRRRTFRLKP